MDTESVVIEISAVLLSAFTTLFSADKCELSAALFDAQPVSARTIANTYARDELWHKITPFNISVSDG